MPEPFAARRWKEEAGIEVGEVRYVASQPWPFPSSLMLGFVGEARSFDLCPDEHELEDVRWFSRDEVRAALEGRGEGLRVPPPLAIAHQLLRTWAVTGT